jgi:REP element-mobilizing transposase RayT
MPDPIDRAWLLTWTTYGSWLPGDERGFIGRVRDRRPESQEPPAPTRRLHNRVGTEQDRDLPGLRRSSLEAMTGAPIRLDVEQARVVADQLLATATFRGWALWAVAVMANHVHLVVGVSGDPDPAILLRDFKSYASRALNATRPGRPGGRWWTESGSRRILRDEASIVGAIRYVQDQDYVLCLRLDSAARAWFGRSSTSRSGERPA